jgi:hypothetical protein
MARIEMDSNQKSKIANEGRNLINNQNEIIDTSNNYELQKNKSIDKDNKNKGLQAIKKLQSQTFSERSPSFGEKGKEIIIASNNDLRSQINSDNNNSQKKPKRQSILSSSINFYRENILKSSLKKIYGSRQKYISIILLIYSSILFLLSFFDLLRQIQNKEGNFLLCNLILFILEMICSGLIVLFHSIYYFININNNTYIIFLIMSIIIIIFSLIYIHIYIKKKVRLIEIILYMMYNLSLVIINFIYLFMSYSLSKKKNKVQQNIEDIMNFSLRNEKIDNDRSKDKNKENKKVMALVEEDIHS